MSLSTEFIPFALPSIGREEEEAVLAVMRSGWLTTGKVARAFEEEFASFAGVPSALAVNSATSGLHLALEALGVGPGDRVVTTPYTFTSTAAVARHLGAEVDFCDISEHDYNIDPKRLASVLRRSKPKAIIVVHLGGYPCAMEEIIELARNSGCAVVEDCAHAFPLDLERGMAGTLGDIGVYSFYATKTMTTGEGGMVVARSPELMKRMALMRMHGFDREAWDRYTSKSASWFYDVAEAGFKYNLPDLLAAIGREQLRKARAFLEERRAIAALYLEAFAGDARLVPPPVHAAHSWHLFSLRLAPGLAETRDPFIEGLKTRGIGASVHFIPLHTMRYWSERYALSPSDFPNALRAYRATVSLPIWQGMGQDKARRVAEAVLETSSSLSVAAQGNLP